MDNLILVHVGDWVRFMRNGLLYIGVVEYIRTSSWTSRSAELVTTCGTLLQEEVLEVRKPPVT